MAREICAFSGLSASLARLLTVREGDTYGGTAEAQSCMVDSKDFSLSRIDL